MNGAQIKISRTPYEEPYHLRLKMAVSNARRFGELEYYCNAADLRRIGDEMLSYSGKKDAEIVYELGSEKREDRFAFFLSLRVQAINLRGHCFVMIRLNNNAPLPDTEVSEFGIRAEVADINRLGGLLVEFGELRHHVLLWRVTSGELIEDQEQVE